MQLNAVERRRLACTVGRPARRLLRREVCPASRRPLQASGLRSPERRLRPFFGSTPDQQPSLSTP
jgi:hypothetical protein